MKKRPLGLFAATAFFTVVYLLFIIFLPEKINHTPEYHWPVLRHGVLVKMIPAAAAIAACIWLVVSFIKRSERAGTSKVKTWQAGLFIFLAALAMQVIPMSMHSMGLLEFPLRIYVADHTSYFTDAANIKRPREFLQKFPKTAQSLHTHSRTHPPLSVMTFWAVNRVTGAFPGFVSWFNRTVPRSEEASRKFDLTPAQVAGGGVAAALITMTACMCAVLAFLTAAEFFGFRAALCAAFIFIFTPAFSHRTPVMDQAFAFFILLAVWILLKALRLKKSLLGFMPGIIVGLGLWFSPVFLAALPLAGAFFLYWLARAKKNGQDIPSFSFILVFSVLFAAGVLIALLGTGALLDLSYLEVYRANMKGWSFNNTASGRVSTWMWILFNPYEFLTWQGAPVLVLLLVSIGMEARRIFKREVKTGSLFFWTVIVFALALDLSGRVCYESPRLVFFLIPFTCMIAVNVLEEKGGEDSGLKWETVLSFQALCILAFRLVF